MPRSGPIYRHQVVQTPPPKGIVASAKVYGGPGAQPINKTGRKTRSDAFQSSLWDLYDTVPEFHYACSWVGNLISKAKLYVAKDGKRIEEQIALDAIASLFGGPEGQEEMLRLLGIHFTVAGDAFIIGTEGGDGDEWRVVASVEVSGQSPRLKVEDEEQGPDTLAIRIWRAHPRKSSEPDPPSRALISDLSQIVRLRQVIAAQGDSRLTSAGILWVPQEMELPSIPVSGGEDDDDSVQTVDGAEGLTKLLTRVASIAISDRSSAAANVPIVISAPGEYLEKIQKTDFWSGFDEHAKELRDETRRTIATGLDIPPEVLSGTADINHWGAWAVEEAAIKIHAEPLLNVIVASLTKGWLQRWLAAEGVEDADRYTLEADTSQLRMRPNRSKEAFELWDRGAINIHTLLVENGFDPENDQPDEKEKIVWFLTKVAQGSTTPDQVAAALRALKVEGIPGSVEPDQESQEGRPDRSLLGHPSREEPDPEESEARGVQASAGPILLDGLVYAGEQAVFRALERAGNRIKTKIGGKVGREASDLYMSAPAMSFTECEDLLADAWAGVERNPYPGVDAGRFKGALHEYALMLLRSQKPYSREALARHLLLELAEES